MRQKFIMPNRNVSATFLLIFLVCPITVWAGEILSSSSPIGEQIKAVQEEVMCRSEKFPEEAAAEAEAEISGYRPDMACATSVAQVTPQVKAGQLHVIDLRSPERFNAFHINGALNLTPGELPAKSYLRGRKLLLVGEGKGERSVYEVCRRLRANGFQSVQVLQGGMLNWLAQGGDVLGQLPALAPARQLSAPELLEEAYFDHNLFVFLSGMTRLNKHFPAASSLNLLKGVGTSAAVLRAIKSRKSAVNAVILLGSEPRLIHSYAEALQKVSVTPVLIYADGLRAYEEAVLRQKAIVVSRERPPRPSKCAL